MICTAPALAIPLTPSPGRPIARSTKPSWLKSPVTVVSRARGSSDSNRRAARLERGWWADLRFDAPRLEREKNTGSLYLVRIELQKSLVSPHNGHERAETAAGRPLNLKLINRQRPSKGLQGWTSFPCLLRPINNETTGPAVRF